MFIGKILSMKPIKKIALGLALIAIGGAIAYYYVFIYSKNHHRNIQAESAIQIQADSLSAQYQLDEVKANSQYLNKVIIVTGNLISKDKNQQGQTTCIIGKADAFSNVAVTLNNNAPINNEIGASITIKGICTGALSDVIITDGVIQ
jgi:hypothetical protein